MPACFGRQGINAFQQLLLGDLLFHGGFLSLCHIVGAYNQLASVIHADDFKGQLLILTHGHGRVFHVEANRLILAGVVDGAHSPSGAVTTYMK